MTWGLLIVFLLAPQGEAQDPPIPPPTGLEAFDTPNDKGQSIALRWDKMPYEADDLSYVVYARRTQDGPEVEAAKITSNDASSLASAKSAPFWAWSGSDLRRYIDVNTDETGAKLFQFEEGAKERTAEVEKAEKDLEEAEKPIKDQKKKIKDLKTEVWQAKMDLLGQMVDIKKFKKSIKKLRSEKKQKEADSLKERVKNLEGQLPDLQRKAKQIREKRAPEIEAAEKELARMEKELTPGIEKKRDRLEELKEALAEDVDEIASGTLFYSLAVVRGETEPARSGWLSAEESDNLFNLNKLHSFLYMLAFCVIIVTFIQLGKRRKLFLRKIPGLSAVDEAIGRATEMGKPVYYLTGRRDVQDVSTIAAVTILGEVTKKCAKLGGQLKVPHTMILCFAISQEIVKQSFTEAGRPDAYRDDINFFVTEDQFGYTAAVDGMFVREKPAAIIYMGYYYAESLILAETGASIGAIQVAGTDAIHQLPFFVTACDYTLIGEELYAAGAYLSGEPVLIGTLRGQDIGKVF
ncbi:MAG: DUF6754 domain-containing protein, partial [Planctomycetota bacterium]